MRALRRLFGGNRAVTSSVLLAVLLALPSLSGGLAVDDYIQLATYFGKLPRHGHDLSLFGLFSFSTGAPLETATLIDSGFLPWWSAPDLRIKFFRPLSELSHALDYSLWPHSAALMHLQSVAWFALLVYLVARLYTAIAGETKQRGLAAYLFAVSAIHATAVGWIAGRNALISACFGVLCLLCYHRWRKQQAGPNLLVATLAFVVGLLGAEAAVATLAYLFAYAVFIDKGSLPRRVLRTLPFGIVFVAWKLGYDSLGFGAYASGLYSAGGWSTVTS